MDHASGMHYIHFSRRDVECRHFQHSFAPVCVFEPECVRICVDVDVAGGGISIFVGKIN